MEDALSINVVKSARELLPSEKKYSEVSVKKYYNVLENWPAIFDDSHVLFLSFGQFADKEVESDWLGAKEIGEQCLEEFVTNCLIEKSVAFYDHINKKKLKTFSSMQANATVRVKQNQISIKADWKILVHMVVTQRKYSINLQEILQYSLEPVAWTLANGDGTIHKTVKSKLLNVLEPKMESVQLPTPVKGGAIIFDGMCLIYQLPPGINKIRLVIFLI